jgi:hypothetical protein
MCCTFDLQRRWCHSGRWHEQRNNNSATQQHTNAQIISFLLLFFFSSLLFPRRSSSAFRSQHLCAGTRFKLVAAFKVEDRLWSSVRAAKGIEEENPNNNNLRSARSTWFIGHFGPIDLTFQIHYGVRCWFDLLLLRFFRCYRPMSHRVKLCDDLKAIRNSTEIW